MPSRHLQTCPDTLTGLPLTLFMANQTFISYPIFLLLSLQSLILILCLLSQDNLQKILTFLLLF